MRFTNVASRLLQRRPRTRSRSHLHTKSSLALYVSLTLLLLLLVSAAKDLILDQNCLQKPSREASFGIAFDIDGVIVRGETPIGNSPKALSRLYEDSGRLKVPYLFLTNGFESSTSCYKDYGFVHGGGVPETKRAADLSSLLGVNISTSQVLQGHTPFRDLVHRFQDGLVVAVGKGEPAAVMSEYGFKKVLSIDEYASYFDNIDPLSHYKNWTIKNEISKDKTSSVFSAPPDRVQAAFIVSDSVDWSRDIQVLCDILRTGGLPGREIGHQPPLYFASDDLEYQAAFPSNRLGMGAFRIALEAIFNRIHSKPLEYTAFGKPNPFVFKNAEIVLKQLQLSTHIDGNVVNDGERGSQTLKTLYMVGDNPSVDIQGARLAGHPWFSILTRTGVFKGKGNHQEFPADLVVDTVEDAVEFILRRECMS